MRISEIDEVACLFGGYGVRSRPVERLTVIVVDSHENRKELVLRHSFHVVELTIQLMGTISLQCICFVHNSTSAYA